MPDKPTVSETVRNLVREGFHHEFGKPKVVIKPAEVWSRIRATGTRLWLDTGDIDEAAKLWNAEFEALTTNNTLLNREVQKGIYDGLVGEAARAIRAAAPDITQQQLVLEIAFVLNARHGLRLVDEFDAHVSVELHTDLANDVERTVAYGRRFYAICPERFYVKVPLSPAGLIGARRLGQAGVPVNFTLGFSARQGYLSALLAQPHYINVFMGRLNDFVAHNKLGSGDNVGEQATLVTQRELRALRDLGKTEARLIGASMRDGSQVAPLAGVDVFTMSVKTAAQYQRNPDPNPVNRVNTNLDVAIAPGIALGDFGGQTLWDTPPAFKACAEDLAAKEPVELTPDAVVDHFARGGFGGVFPRWSEADIQTVMTDGKIPVHATWKDRLASGEVGLDALMNLSAYYSFVSDQKALDDRIRGIL